MEKEEKKQKKVLTENRMATVNKRETSFEGLVGQLENGEDGIYNLMSDSKTIIFQPKISITKKDLETIPLLAQLKEAINIQEAALKRASGKKAYAIKKALIEMRKDQYLIKQAYQKPIVPNKLTRTIAPFIPLEDTSYIDENDELVIQGVSLMDWQTCSAILCNYSKLKEDSYGNFKGDTWYLMESFDEIADRALRDHPLYERLVELKIDGVQNMDIQPALEAEFGVTHSLEYLSSLWRNKIPKLIAKAAQEDFIEWHYRINNLPMKKCSKCGQEKPAHNHFFSKNKTSKDGWYSICKCCRNKKVEKE